MWLGNGCARVKFTESLHDFDYHNIYGIFGNRAFLAKNDYLWLLFWFLLWLYLDINMLAFLLYWSE